MRLKLSDLGAFERPSEPIASRAATQLGAGRRLPRPDAASMDLEKTT